MRYKPGWGVGDIDPRKITIRSVVRSLGNKSQEDAEASSWLLMTEFELEALDDINDFRTDALLSLHGGGADMSGRLENVPVAHF